MAKDSLWEKGIPAGGLVSMVADKFLKEELSNPREDHQNEKTLDYGMRMADIIRDVHDLQISHGKLEGRTKDLERRQDSTEKRVERIEEENKSTSIMLATVSTKQDNVILSVGEIKDAVGGLTREIKDKSTWFWKPLEALYKTALVLVGLAIVFVVVYGIFQVILGNWPVDVLKGMFNL